MSIDGYIGERDASRLALSNDADFDRVDAVRASCDAILVGAATVRNDNPRLLVRSQDPPRRADGPWARAVADQGHRDRSGGARRARRLLHHRRQPRSSSTAPSPRVADARARLGPVATVVDGGQPVEMRRLSDDLARPRRASG